jgi:hypothetical protein
VKIVAVYYKQVSIIMAIDALTLSLLTSALGSSATRKLFKTIVNLRIVDTASLKEVDPEADQALKALRDADLISSAADKYFVTAKGLKVARDLEQTSD